MAANRWSIEMAFEHRKVATSPGLLVFRVAEPVGPGVKHRYL